MSEYFMPISELSKLLDIPAHTLRYWEKEFPTLIQPTTGAGGRRYYRPETVGGITALKRYLYADGYTIDGVKKLIAEGGFQSDKAPVPAEPESKTNNKPDNKKDIRTAIDLLDQAKKLLND